MTLIDGHEYSVSSWRCGVKLFRNWFVFIFANISTTMLIDRGREFTVSETDVSQTGGHV